MKNVSFMITIFFCIGFGGVTEHAQQISRKSGYYYLVENNVSVRIKSTDLRTLLLSQPDAREIYYDAKDLERHTWIFAGATFSCLMYFGFKSLGDQSNLSLSVKPENNYNPVLLLGGVFVSLGVIKGVKTWLTYRKAIDTYNHRVSKQKSNDHSLNIIATPGGVSLTYQF